MHSTPNNLFDPNLYRSVRNSIESATPLPHWCYHSPHFFQRELETIFARQWLFLCKADAISKPGDFWTDTPVGIPVLIVRDEDGVLHAFINACRHRGCKVASGTGHAKRLICPYHRWTYALDGRLLRAPGLSSGQISSDLDRLRPLPCEEVEGLVFVNLDPDAPAFSTTVPEFVERYRQYCIPDLQVVASRSYEVESNWKTYIEVDMETLHTPNIHKVSIGTQKTELTTTKGDWIGLYSPADQTIALKPDEKKHAFDFIPTLKADGCQGTFFSVVFPGFFLVTTCDCVWWINKLPLSPERTRVETSICFHPNAVEEPDFEARVQHYISRWEQVILEDNWITEVQQQGLRGAVQGRYTRLENAVHRLDNWILDQVLDEQHSALGDGHARAI